MPFVQGQLRNESITITFRTECGHCARALRLEVNSAGRSDIAEAGPNPLVYVPVIDFTKLKAPNIIDDF